MFGVHQYAHQADHYYRDITTHDYYTRTFLANNQRIDILVPCPIYYRLYCVNIYGGVFRSIGRIDSQLDLVENFTDRLSTPYASIICLGIFCCNT